MLIYCANLLHQSIAPIDCANLLHCDLFTLALQVLLLHCDLFALALEVLQPPYIWGSTSPVFILPIYCNNLLHQSIVQIYCTVTHLHCRYPPPPNVWGSPLTSFYCANLDLLCQSIAPNQFYYARFYDANLLHCDLFALVQQCPTKFIVLFNALWHFFALVQGSPYDHLMSKGSPYQFYYARFYCARFYCTNIVLWHFCTCTGGSPHHHLMSETSLPILFC